MSYYFNLSAGHVSSFWSPWGKFDAGPRCNFGCAAIDNEKVLIAGGSTARGYEGLSSCYIWNSRDKTWKKLPDLPEKMPYCRAARLHNFVYVMGESGFYRYPIVSLEFERIEDEQNSRNLQTWKKLPLDPIHGSGFSLVSSWQMGKGINQPAYLYRVGGIGDLRGAAKFCPIKDDWELLPLLQTGRCHHACAVVKETLFVIGGINGNTGEGLRSMEVLIDKEKNTPRNMDENINDGWQYGPDLPITLCYSSALVLESDYIVITGGKILYIGKPEPYCFFKHYKNSSWRRLPEDLTQSFAEHSAVTTGNNLVYVMGGINNSLMLRENMGIIAARIDLYSRNDSMVYLNSQNSFSSYSLSFKDERETASMSHLSSETGHKEKEEGELYPSDWTRFFSCCAVPDSNSINYNT